MQYQIYKLELIQTAASSVMYQPFPAPHHRTHVTHTCGFATSCVCGLRYAPLITDFKLTAKVNYLQSPSLVPACHQADMSCA